MTELEKKLSVIVDCLPDSPFKEKVRETLDEVKQYWGASHAKLAECQARESELREQAKREAYQDAAEICQHFGTVEACLGYLQQMSKEGDKE